jgi:hypothetical protein
MIKRFWPLLILIIVVILAAIIIPAAAGLEPHIIKQNDPNTYETLICLDLPVDAPRGNFPDDVKAGEPFQVVGHLFYFHQELFDQYQASVAQKIMATYKKTGVLPLEKTVQEQYADAVAAGVIFPLQDRRILISTELNYKAYFHYKPDVNTNTTKNVYTDKDGYFSTTIQIDSLSKWHRWVGVCYYEEQAVVVDDAHAVVVTHKGCNVTLPRGKSAFYLWSPGQEGGVLLPESINTAGAVMVTVLFLAVVTYFVYRYRRQIREWLNKRKAKNVVPVPVVTKAVRELVPTVDQRVEILFPQIENPLPLVWGAGEPLTINCRVLVDKVEGEIKYQPQIEIKDNTLDISTPGFASLQVERTFSRKGDVIINVHFGGDTGEKLFGTHQIRIVDYREEIVALFNQLIDSLSAKGVKVDRKMTAREIGVQLRARNPELAPEVLEDIVRGFESANYSLHAVARKIYVEMYLAVKQIEERAKNE